MINFLNWMLKYSFEISLFLWILIGLFIFYLYGEAIIG